MYIMYIVYIYIYMVTPPPTVLEIARSRHVLQKQKEIHFGARHKWCDVEADEVDIGKEVDLQHKRAKWEQWGGIVERGQPSTLVLFRLPPKTTAVRSPGPGPITKRDWKPIAHKFLENRDVILHTDGAKTYKMKLSLRLLAAVMSSRNRRKSTSEPDTNGVMLRRMKLISARKLTYSTKGPSGSSGVALSSGASLAPWFSSASLQRLPLCARQVQAQSPSEIGNPLLISSWRIVM